MKLNADQEKAREIFLKRYRAKEPLTEMTGPAGSGKSFLVSRFIADLGLKPFDTEHPERGGYIVCAPTNKSASILRRRGVVGATTAHRVTSKPRVGSQERVHELLEQLHFEEMANPASIRFREIKHELSGLLSVKFDDNWAAVLRQADLIIADEGGMIPRSVALRLKHIGVPILATGDPFQLDPVGEAPLFLVDRPHIHLETIERQAEDSEILGLATRARLGQDIAPGKYGKTVAVRARRPSNDLIAQADAVIVGRHQTRRFINNEVRRLKGYDSHTPPQPGEKFVSTKTVNPGLSEPLIHASSFVTLDDIQGNGTDYDAKIRVPDEDCLINGMPTYRMWGGPFADHDRFVKERKLNELTGMSYADRQLRLQQHALMAEIDYANAVTCHRMQGDEADNGIVINDGWGITHEQRRRWLYTALTRFRKGLYLSLV